jgi:uncharacterized protein (TIGR02757 family)
MIPRDLQSFLDERVALYNQPSFIETDPIQIPKQFERKENIEISAFLTATISWGSRPVIIRNSMKLMRLMNNNPYDFICTASDSDFENLNEFRHRTFNVNDCVFFVNALRNIYKNHGGLENVISEGYLRGGTIRSALEYFHSVFFGISHPEHVLKHVADVMAGSAAKRLNMFLRWMVRNDKTGVDFGLWQKIPASSLMLPLDVHTGTVARKLGLLTRKQNDWKAVEEVTGYLRNLDPDDPVKYDFALFGLGIFEKF